MKQNIRDCFDITATSTQDQHDRLSGTLTTRYKRSTSYQYDRYDVVLYLSVVMVMVS